MATTRTAKSALIKTLEQTAQPVLMLDDKRNIIFVNQACCAWTGLTLEQLTDLECRYHSSDDVEGAELIATSFCPPAEVFEGHAAAVSVTIAGQDGESSTRSVTFHPLESAEKVIAVLGIATEREEAEEDSTFARQQTALPGSLHELIQKHRAKKYQNVNLAKWVGNGSQAKQIQIKIESAIRAHANTLIVGPRGVGKEHLANLVHQSSTSGNPDGTVAGKILSIDCQLADQESIQDTVRYMGRFGSPGTNRVLLKRVELLSEAAQQELLGFLEMPAFQLTLISTSEIIGVAQGDSSLDEQLLRFLDGIRIELPPLQDRVDDIPYLVQLFVEQQNAQTSKQCFGFEQDAMDAMMLHDWPGNLNELSEVVRRAFETCKTSKIQFEDLPRELHVALDAHAVPGKEKRAIDLDEELHKLEKNLIEQAVVQSKGNKAKAARMLGINRARLLRRIEYFDGSNTSKKRESGNDAEN